MIGFSFSPGDDRTVDQADDGARRTPDCHTGPDRAGCLNGRRDQTRTKTDVRANGQIEPAGEDDERQTRRDEEQQRGPTSCGTIRRHVP